MTDPSAILALLGLMLSAGFVLGHYGERFGIPRVATYVVVGTLFSETLLGGLLPGRTRDWDPLLIDTSLGAVAFLIGGELPLKRVTRLGRVIVGSAIGQSLGTLLLVSVVLWAYSQAVQLPAAWTTALVIGAIATATGPATSIAVIEQYRAKGPLTTALLGIVLLADALSIVLFTLVIGWGTEGRASLQLLHAGYEIVGSILLGGMLGVVLAGFARQVHHEDLRLPLIVGSILLAIGVARWLDLSPLLTCMLLGIVSKQRFGTTAAQPWLRPMQHIQEVIFLTLFVLAGTHFQPSVFMQVPGFIGLYVAARIAGKYVGAWAAATVAGADRPVRRYLGITLLPQAGVAIGLALTAADNLALQEQSSIIVNTILGTTILFELFAPLLTKLALTRAGERDAHTP